MAGEKLVSILLDASKHGEPETEKSDIVYGTVASIAPLRIKIEGESKLILSETFLKLSPWCLEKKISLTPKKDASEIDEGDTSEEVGDEILLWRGLKVGDKVLMLRARLGNFYYVLQREGSY